VPDVVPDELLPLDVVVEPEVLEEVVEPELLDEVVDPVLFDVVVEPDVLDVLPELPPDEGVLEGALVGGVTTATTGRATEVLAEVLAEVSLDETAVVDEAPVVDRTCTAKAASATEEALSLAVITIALKMPASDSAGVPLISPVMMLKLAHAGLF